MKEIQVTKYQCEYCGEIFDIKKLCEFHERDMHKCPNCAYSYYVYGGELACDRINQKKYCKFMEKPV